MLARSPHRAPRPGPSERAQERTVVLVFLARTAMSAGRALAGIVTPLYLAARGFDPVRLGAIFLVVAAASVVLSATVGLTSDRIGRRPFLILFPLLTAGAGLVFALSTSTALLFVAAAAGSFGRGAGAGAGAVGPYQPAESALVTDMSPPQRRNVVFGRLAFGSSLGALAGSLLALLAAGAQGLGSTTARAAALGDYRDAFFATAAVSLVAGILALWIEEPPRSQLPGPTVFEGPPSPAGAAHPEGTAGSVDSHRPPGPPETQPETGQPGPGRPARADRVRPPHSTRELLARLGLTNSVNGLAVGMVGPFLTYWFARRYGVDAGEIGVLFALANASTLASTLTAAGMARRFGLVRIVSITRVLQAVLLVPMVLAPSFVAAGAFYLVRMLIQRVGLPLRQSYVLAVADPSRRSAVAALANVPSQVTMTVGPLVTGALIAEVSLSLPFLLAAGVQLVNAAMFWAFFRNRPPEEERAAIPDPDAEVG